MEHAFGLSFDPVQVRVGAGAALDALHADAVAIGGQITFRATQPAPAQVAHELTHVLQQGGAPTAARIVGVSSPDSAAEAEAGANAARMAGGQAPLAPAVAAAGGVVYRDIKQDLHKAVAGWGTDEAAIFTRLQLATPEEKAQVRSDPQLMDDLDSDLSRDEWGYVLGLLGVGAASRIHAASAGWGTDEEGIFRALRNAPAPELQALVAEGTVPLELRDELSDRDLGHALAIIADKMQHAGAFFEPCYHVLMLYPDLVPVSLGAFETTMGNHVVAGVIRQLPRGYLMQPATVADVNVHIANDDNLARVQAAFEQRWNVNTSAMADAKGKVPAWTVSRIRELHAALQQLPPAHITRAKQIVAGFKLDASVPEKGHWDSPNIRVGTEFKDVAALTRHEVGHQIDDKLGAASTKFKQDPPNFWTWEETSAGWESAMARPWLRKDGSTVPAADQTAIKGLLDSYVRTTAGDQSLDQFAGAKHVIKTYWSDNVGMIEAAKSIAELKDDVYKHHDKTKLYGSKYFSFSVYYKRFYTYDKFVFDNRVDRDWNYSLHGPKDFFAVLYEYYYADGAGPDRGRRLAGVPAWKQFFDTVVHPTA